MHYAVPSILHNAGMLTRLHTDICATQGFPIMIRKLWPKTIQPKAVTRLLGRLPVGIPTSHISSYTLFGLNYAQKQRSARTPAELTAVHLWAGKKFNELIIRHGFDHASAIYTFNSAGAELLREAKRHGIKTVVEQTIAPKVIEQALLSKELENFPETTSLVEPPDSWKLFAEREALEWELADLIICGSQFVVDGIIEAGGPATKAVVVPYGTNFPVLSNTFNNRKTTNVLFVGQVGLRKGARYLIEAARLVQRSNPEISFRLVGPINLPDAILKKLPDNLKLTGSTPRSEIHKQFQWADVFCLPSICEGSATAIYEALAMGLPVICTKNSGSIVSHGIDGFIVPVADSLAIAERIIEVFSTPQLISGMSNKARDKAAKYTTGEYGTRLLRALKVEG